MVDNAEIWVQNDALGGWVGARFVNFLAASARFGVAGTPGLITYARLLGDGVSPMPGARSLPSPREKRTSHTAGWSFGVVAELVDALD